MMSAAPGESLGAGYVLLCLLCTVECAIPCCSCIFFTAIHVEAVVVLIILIT